MLANDIAQCLAGVVEQASQRFYRDLDSVHIQVERSVEQVRTVMSVQQRSIATINQSSECIETAVQALRGSAASRSAEIASLRDRLQELRAATQVASGKL